MTDDEFGEIEQRIRNRESIGGREYGITAPDFTRGWWYQCLFAVMSLIDRVVMLENIDAIMGHSKSLHSAYVRGQRGFFMDDPDEQSLTLVRPVITRKRVRKAADDEKEMLRIYLTIHPVTLVFFWVDTDRINHLRIREGKRPIFIDSEPESFFLDTWLGGDHD